MKTFKGKNNEVLGTFLENTDVVVNPTLVGDEPEMTGIQVGGQKYKAPQGGGGGETYTAGEGINISEDNVISAEKTIVLVNELPNEGEADKLYKLPNGDVYEWAEIETQTDITEISVGKRFILADTINRSDYSNVVTQCFKVESQSEGHYAGITKDLRIACFRRYFFFTSYSSPNIYSSYSGFYFDDQGNCHRKEQNFEHYPFIEITQTLVDNISTIGGSIEYMAPLFKKEVIYSYGWNKISNYKLSESLELVDGSLSVKNGFVNEGQLVSLTPSSNYLYREDIEKLFYTDYNGRIEGFKNCGIGVTIYKSDGFPEDFNGKLKPEGEYNDGWASKFCSGINKSENGEFRAVVEFIYNYQIGAYKVYDTLTIRRSIEYTTYTLFLTPVVHITEQIFNNLVLKDNRDNFIFKNSFLKIKDNFNNDITLHPSEINNGIKYRSELLKSRETGNLYCHEITIDASSPQHPWSYDRIIMNKEPNIPSWCNGYILTSNYTQMKKARLNINNLKLALFNSRNYLSEPISSFIGTGTSYITIAILNSETSSGWRNSMITFICEKQENPEDCRIVVQVERQPLYLQEHTFDSENFTWLDVFEFLHNEADISDFNLCNAYFDGGTMRLETPDPDEGLVLYDSVRFGFSNEIIFGNNDSNLYGLVLIKDVKGFFDLVIVEGGSSSSSSSN